MTMLLLAVGGNATPNALPDPPTDKPQWATIPASDPLIAQFANVSEVNKIYWTSVIPDGNSRFFLSNHPESFGQLIRLADGYPDQALGTEWPVRGINRILWYDIGQGRGNVDYRVLINHQNYYGAERGQPGIDVYIGVVAENLSGVPVSISGGWSGHRGPWGSLWSLPGEVNSYNELTGALPNTINTTVASGEKALLTYWLLPPGSINVHMKLHCNNENPTNVVRCKLSTILTFSDPAQTLAGDTVPVYKKPMTLIEHHGPHPRGSWSFAEQSVTNIGNMYDIGAETSSLKILPLYTQIGNGPGNKSFAYDISQTGGDPGSGWNHAIGADTPGGHSYNSRESTTNTGMYGVISHVKVYVKNSTTVPKNLAIQFYYLPTDRGTFNGACRILDDTNTWEVRRIDLRRSFYPRTTTTTTDSPLATDIVKQYSVPANCASKAIQFDIITDGPGTLPLGIVIRRL